MEAYEMEEALRNILLGEKAEYTDLCSSDGEGTAVKKAYSFSDLGLLTRDNGLEITLEDGSVFQLSIRKISNN